MKVTGRYKTLEDWIVAKVIDTQILKLLAQGFELEVTITTLPKMMESYEGEEMSPDGAWKNFWHPAPHHPCG